MCSSDLEEYKQKISFSSEEFEALHLNYCGSAISGHVAREGRIIGEILRVNLHIITIEYCTILSEHNEQISDAYPTIHLIESENTFFSISLKNANRYSFLCSLSSKTHSSNSEKNCFSINTGDDYGATEALSTLYYRGRNA